MCNECVYHAEKEAVQEECRDFGAFENQLFTWEGWDEQDTMAFTFYNVCLVRDVGSFPAGTTFPFVYVSYETSVVEFSVHDEEREGYLKPVLTCRLKLAVEVL